MVVNFIYDGEYSIFTELNDWRYDKIKYLSLFSGIGGFELGILNSKYGDTLECVGYAEVDKYADSIYRRQFGEHKAFGDVTRIETSDLPDFDLLVGGFPCQAFSIAGKRGGFSDTRGTLFFEIARILKDKRPRYFLLENVKGLLSHDKGKTFKTILEVLSDLGYDVSWQVLNSKNHGVPQNRERIFIKGYSRDRCRGEVLSFSRESEETIEKIDSYVTPTRGSKLVSINGINGTLTSGGLGSGSRTCIDEREEPQIKKVGNFSDTNHHGNNVYAVDGISPTLCSSSVVKNGVNIIEESDVDLIRVNKSKHQAQTVYDPDGLSCTLSANGGGDGGKTGLYRINVSEIQMPVMKRKHTANIDDLKVLLQTSKKQSQLSNNEIAHKLDIPRTTVEHWFRKDESFSIPAADVWYDLKTLLQISDDSFDAFITEFEVVDGEFDMSNRLYDVEGIAPTLNCNNQGLYKINLINKENVVHQHDGVYSPDGIAPCMTACDYKDPIKIKKCIGSTQKNACVTDGTYAPTLTGAGGGNIPMIEEETEEPLLIGTATKKGYDKAYPSDGVRLDHPGSNTGRGRVQPESTGALTCNAQWGTVDDDYRVRKLTPVECERLQGFPDNWTALGVDDESISNTQRYKCLGNAVTTNVITHIFNTWDLIE